MKNDVNVIDVKGLNKYFGEVHAVKDLDLQVKRGEIFGFLGPNGSGKTTTIRMLCGLLTPDSGTGHCLGYDILTQSREIKKHVGYMTQRFSYYEDMSVYENFEFIARIYGVKQRKKKIKDITERFHFKEYIDRLAGELSGGWKQRMALAGCLLHEPQLLLLDEPTAGVDPKARRDFWEEIHELSAQGITTLVSTHYMDEAERCTRLAYIAFGNLLVQGTISEIIQKVGLITWSVRGPNLSELARDLKNSKGVDQIIIFGEALHISGKDEKNLTEAISPYKEKSEYKWQRIDTNLEDVFISLFGKN